MARSIGELTIRRTVCDKFIRELMVMDDPRAKDAIEHYTVQLKGLDAELEKAHAEERKQAGIPAPENVVVSVHSAKIFGIIEKE